MLAEVCILRVEFDGLAEVGQTRFEVAAVELAGSPLGERLGIVRIEFNGLGVVLNRPVVVFLIEVLLAQRQGLLDGDGPLDGRLLIDVRIGPRLPDRRANADQEQRRHDCAEQFPFRRWSH